MHRAVKELPIVVSVKGSLRIMLQFCFVRFHICVSKHVYHIPYIPEKLG